MKRLLVFLTMTLLLTSCGGGGGGNTVSTFETPTLTAYYVDAPAKGLVYESSPSGLSGVTDESGSFRFKQGDVVSFYLDPVNRIYLGKVAPVSEQVVIAAIANSYESHVDASLVSLILFTMDKALAGAGFMDFSDLVLSSSLADKIKLFLSRKAMPNQIDDIWQSMASLQTDAASYTFRNSGGNLSYSNFKQHIFNTVGGLAETEIRPDDFSGVYSFNVGITNVFFQFLPNGLMYGIRDDGSVASGTYVIDAESLKFQWDINLGNHCESSISLNQRGSRWSLLTVREIDTPAGCTQSTPNFDVVTKAKINTSIDISFLSGKNLRIPVKGVCSLGDGEAVFSIAASGLTADQRSVNFTSPNCTGNVLISGTVRESGVPGILVFEFDSASPKIKFFFSLLEDSGRALTQLSIEKTVPTTEFDFVYGAETSFTLD